jgi:hypothetical protein
MRDVRRCVFGYGVGVYGWLTKRLVEQHDPGALVTAVRWLGGPIVKAGWARMAGRSAPEWNVVLSETAGAMVGPFCFGLESWHARSGGSE